MFITIPFMPEEVPDVMDQLLMQQSQPEEEA
jgi:hypothetical protein